MRSRLVACLVGVAFGGVASAQPGNTLPNNKPQDPYGPQPPPQKPVGPTPAPGPAPAPAPGPQPPPPPTSDDPVLAEQIAQTLVHRAQELFDARVFNDAKQLAVEALVKSPKGAAAEHAKYLIKKINAQLGIEDEKPNDKVDLTPIQDRRSGKTSRFPTPRSNRAPAG
jgi:hypothetical protein